MNNVDDVSPSLIRTLKTNLVLFPYAFPVAWHIFNGVVRFLPLLSFIIDTVRRTVYTALYSLHPVVFLTARKLVVDGIVSVVDTLVSVSPRRIIVERRARQVLEDKDALLSYVPFIPPTCSTLATIFSRLFRLSA